MGLMDNNPNMVDSHELNRVIWILLSRTKDKEIRITRAEMLDAMRPGSGVQVLDHPDGSIVLRAIKT